MEVIFWLEFCLLKELCIKLTHCESVHFLLLRTFSECPGAKQNKVLCKKPSNERFPYSDSYQWLWVIQQSQWNNNVPPNDGADYFWIRTGLQRFRQEWCSVPNRDLSEYNLVRQWLWNLIKITKRIQTIIDKS